MRQLGREAPGGASVGVLQGKESIRMDRCQERDLHKELACKILEAEES